jgi:class 3 adenylate cyclase
MPAINLARKKIDLNFYHKGSEVAYDPTNKYYQVSFDFDFETAVYDFLDTFINGAVLSDEKLKDFGALPQEKNMTGLYFDILADFNNAQWRDFSSWYYNHRVKLQAGVKAVILNAILGEKETGIEGLEFFSWTAVATLIAVISEEYFQRNFDTLKIMRDTLGLRLGKAFELLLKEVFNDEEVSRTRAEKTGGDKKKIEPLLNRYSLMFSDPGDMAGVERIIFSKDKSVFIDRTIFNRLLNAFEAVVDASKNVRKNDSLKNILSDMGLIKTILKSKRDRNSLLKLLGKDGGFMPRLAMKYETHAISKELRGIVAETGSSDLINFILHEDSVEEIFTDSRVKKYALKALKGIGNRRAKETAKYIGYACGRIKRAGRSFIGGLLPNEKEKILTAGIENFSGCLKVMNDFSDIRRKFGKKTSYGEEMLGIKILRQSFFRQGKKPDSGRECIECVRVPSDQRTRIDNLFEEGNLFNIRAGGAIYPGGGGAARGKKFFMFADLRNSTETTMKLTKDTAGFLTPYLNAVYKMSVSNGGNEIYFAGDGYAAHYSKVSESVRSAYLIHNEFAGLRREAEVKIRDKERAIFKELVKFGVVNTEMEVLPLNSADEAGRADEIKDFIAISHANPGMNIEDVLNIVAGEYSMPRVQIGIGITEGDLFFAVIGEENNARFNIVLSPSLTQAARLSGSAAEVKRYLEKLYGIKNIPRMAYAQNRKLFNQGIVMTEQVFSALKKEVEVGFVEAKDIELSYGVFYYYDTALDKYISLAKLDEPIELKGIEGDVQVYEVFTSAAQIDSYVNSWLKKRKMG